MAFILTIMFNSSTFNLLRHSENDVIPPVHMHPNGIRTLLRASDIDSQDTVIPSYAMNILGVLTLGAPCEDEMLSTSWHLLALHHIVSDVDDQQRMWYLTIYQAVQRSEQDRRRKRGMQDTIRINKRLM